MSESDKCRSAMSQKRGDTGSQCRTLLYAEQHTGCNGQLHHQQTLQLAVYPQPHPPSGLKPMRFSQGAEDISKAQGKITSVLDDKPISKKHG